MKDGNLREGVHVVNKNPNKNKPEVFNYYIDEWVGRLGNNLLQLAHATALAYKYGGIVTYEPHDILKSIPIAFGHIPDNMSTKIVNDFDYLIPEDKSFVKRYRYDMLKKFGNSLFYKRRSGSLWSSKLLGYDRAPMHRGGDYFEGKKWKCLRCQKVTEAPLRWVEGETKYKCNMCNSVRLEQITSNIPCYDVTFHFRGGDVWGLGTPHRNYVQASLAYYEMILEQEKPKRVLMVCEDLSNPLIRELQNKYKKNIHLEISKGEELECDIGKILNSKVLVASSAWGTFLPALASCSSIVEKTYFPIFSDSDSVLLQGYKKICSETYGLRHYDYIKQGDWDQRPEQIEVMLNYPKSNIKAEST